MFAAVTMRGANLNHATPTGDGAERSITTRITTADPTRCAAHRLLTAVTASVTGGLVAKLRGRYNRTPLHATISHTMTLTTAARRICWRFWQHTGPVMTPPLYTALLSASESPQACQAPAVLVSIGPTAGFNKKNSLKTTPFAFSEGYRLCRGFGVYRNFFIPATVAHDDKDDRG